jgi:phosphoribosyl-ATP pyrophosphohydrolase/phosphoribosyl-AMP cyclohydrolase
MIPGPEQLTRIDWDKGGGLVPVIVQDAADASVLMLGYMNREALQRTLESGRVTFFSRSRQQLWQKGATSGNHLTLKSLRLDCDSDALLLTALPAGPVCHTGTRSCFGDAAASADTRLGFLTQLQALIEQRAGADAAGSYTARLLRDGPRRIAQKVGEEGLEVALAACVEDDAALLGECADLVYHLLVLLRARRLSLQQVIDTLERRHAAAQQPG